MIGNPALEVHRKILASKLEIFLFLPCLFGCLFLLLYFVETGLHLSQASLGFTIELKITFTVSFSSLYVPSARVTGIQTPYKVCMTLQSKPWASCISILSAEPQPHLILLLDRCSTV